ncbi:MAG TPA: glycosyltransferase family 39 protein, partial [Roseiflexaceae bacterium]
MCIGIGLRLWMIRVSPLDPRFSDADDGDYYHRALRLAVTGQYVDDSWLIRPPLHVFFFALWLRLALLLGQPQLGVLFVELAQTAVAALTILLGHSVARRLFRSERVGLLFAAFLALWFSFVEQPSVLFSELLYLFLFLLHFWLLLRFDATGRRRDLALSGVALGAAALTRSPALYSLAFVVLWLVVRYWNNRRAPDQLQIADCRLQIANPDLQSPPASACHPSASLRASLVTLSPCHLVTQVLLVIACCLAVVLPWTARNYIVYQRFIPVDTLGQTNLWLDLDAVDKRNEHISAMRRLPQADRASYAMARAREILAADPWRPFRPMWDTFRHIWKLQFVEDYFVKRSFFSRPLRAAAPLGLAGDLLWLVYTVGGLIGLAAPPREGLHNRL